MGVRFIKRILIGWFSAVLLSGCVEKETDYHIPFEGAQLVALALLENNQVGSVRIHRTFDPDAPDWTIAVPDARVWLQTGDQTLTEFSYVATEDEYEKGSLYRTALPVQFQPGQDYVLMATVEGLPALESAPVRLPELIRIDSLFPLTIDSLLGNPFLAYTQLELSGLKPDEGYTLDLVADYRDATGQQPDLTDVFTFLHYSAPFAAERTLSGSLLRLPLTLPLTKNSFGETGYFFVSGTLYLNIQHLSAAYAAYFDLVTKNGGESELGGFFSTFKNYPDNFTGGYGIFGISNTLILPIEI